MPARLPPAVRVLLLLASIAAVPQITSHAEAQPVADPAPQTGAQVPIGAAISPEQPALRAAIEAAPGPSPAQLPPAPIAPAQEPRRPALLAPLYGSFVGLQALDVHSTRLGLSSGRAQEANPLMKGVAGSSAGLIAVKAAATAGIIFGSEKLWKRNRVAAVVVMVALNSATAAIVARNYSIADTKGRRY